MPSEKEEGILSCCCNGVFVSYSLWTIPHCTFSNPAEGNGFFFLLLAHEVISYFCNWR